MSATNNPAPGVSFFTPHQVPKAGTAKAPVDGTPLPTLFEPIKIRGLEFQNRIFLSPLCQYSAKDGIVTPWHMAHLGGIISRGPGLSFVEATAVLPEGRITPEDVGIWSDAHIQPFSQLTEFAHSQSQKIAIQIGHAGRKASTVAPWLNGPPVASVEAGGWPENVWAPSPIAYSDSYAQPRELSVQDIKRTVSAFADAAKRAVKAGFDVIEIHGAHGYLISSFLSPTSNKRTDEYGGSFENRSRLAVEVVDAVRAVIPDDMPLFFRVSGTEWLEESSPDEPSWRAEDTAKLALILAEHGVDLLDVSAGGNSPLQKIRPGPAYQVPFAAAAKKAVGSKMFVSAVGGLFNGTIAQAVLDSGSADVVFVGRYFQKNPGQVWQIAEELGVDVRSANQIQWGFAGRGNRSLGSHVTVKKGASL